MKKVLFLIIATVGLLFLPLNVDAASASVKASASSSKINLGSSVTVTVTITGSIPIGSWQYNLVYDTAKLTLTSSTNSTYIVDYASSSSTYKKSYTYTFKSKALGSAAITIKNAAVVDFASVSDMSVTPSGCTITVANFSSNANLSALSVADAELNPAFNADTTTYNVSVANTVSSITIAATAADSTATVGGIGTFAVIEGSNTFTVSVTAENGTTKAYTINVDVSEKNPITVTIDKESYTLVRNAGKVETPLNYTASTVTISDQTIATYTSDVTKLTLVVLKDSTGKFLLAIYKSGKYEKYVQIASDSITLSLSTPLSSVKIPNGYIKTTVKIADETVNAWKLKNSKSSQFYLIYGTDVETGTKGFYSYDKKDQTLQRFNNEQATNLSDTVHTYLIVIIALGVLLLSLVGMCIYQLKSNKKPKDKKISDKILKKFEKLDDTKERKKEN